MTTPLCILLIDDSEFFLNLESRFLQHTPASVITATTAEKGIDLVRQYRPSLAFIDIDMPGTDGLACCRQIKADPTLDKTPVVLIGDSDVPGHEMAARSAGSDAYLSKPIDRRLFLDTGHSFLTSIDRREFRHSCNISVLFTVDGVEAQGCCLDISSGGMFLSCLPTAPAGRLIQLQFTLPDESRTEVKLCGRIAWSNVEGEGAKPDYPSGYGVEFVNIPIVVGIALRSCFGT